MSRPTLAVGIIARNEARDLPKCIASLHGVADVIVVVDTGSDDNTAEIAQKLGAVVSIYTGASEWVEPEGRWRLTHFSKARNHAIEQAEALGTTFYMWMDADDVLVTPAALKRQLYREDADVLGAWIESGGYRWIHHRLWRTDKHVRFRGRCHEYAVLDGLRQAQMDDVTIRHDAAADANQENSNIRNLRLLTMEWEEDPTARTAFYLGNTHKDAGRWREAAEWYQRRIAFGEGFLDEYLFSCLYRARALRELKEYGLALEQIKSGREKAPGWAEFIMLESQIAYDEKRYTDAIYHATSALDLPPSQTVLWREPTMYKDQPARMISWCYEHTGNIPQAIAWAQIAKERIGGPDQQWDARIARLRGMTVPHVKIAKQNAIALCRPGAIGDILMTLNLIPALREANPGHQIWYFCDKFLGQPEQLGTIMRQAGVDQVMDCAHWDQWKDTAERAIQLVGYPLAEGYPEKPMRRHLLEYFANEMSTPEHLVGWHGIGVSDGNWNLPALTLPRPKDIGLIKVPYVSMQVSAGWSKYKELPDRKKWGAIRRALEPEVIKFWHIDKESGLSLSESISLFANARMHIGIDSFCNHLTNYYWEDKRGNGRRVPGVILWGSTQASAAGYPHNTNIRLGLPCQPCFRENPAISRMPRSPCINPPRATYEDDTPWACMDDISVERVVEAVREMWEKTE